MSTSEPDPNVPEDEGTEETPDTPDEALPPEGDDTEGEKKRRRLRHNDEDA